ncbi:MAG TPA: response regulator [Longimicrobiales bacterium]|nr:response regulator [Longimicrobiales bacterium]
MRSGPEPALHDQQDFPITAVADRKRQLVLVAEDEHHDWLIYGKLLWYNGYDVLHAETGDDGLRLARKHKPDLVLADLMLPGMNGIEMCREIKQDPETSHIPVIMLTARRAAEYGSRATSAGCATFLEKPIGPVDVLHEVERMVGRAPPPVD